MKSVFLANCKAKSKAYDQMQAPEQHARTLQTPATGGGGHGGSGSGSTMSTTAGRWRLQGAGVLLGCLHLVVGLGLRLAVGEEYGLHCLACLPDLEVARFGVVPLAIM